MIKSISVLFSLCIFVRLLLVYGVYSKKYKNVMSYIFAIIAFGLLYQYVKNNRIYGAFGQKVWWQNFRLYHSLVYLWVIFMLQNNYNELFIVKILLLDLFVAILGHIYFNYFI